MSELFILCAVLGSLITGFGLGYFLMRRYNSHRILYENTVVELNNKRQELDLKSNQINELSQKIASRQAIQDYLELDLEAIKKAKAEADLTLNDLRTKLTHYESQNEFLTQQRTKDLIEIQDLNQKIDILTFDKQSLYTLKSDIELQLNTSINKNDLYEKQRITDLTDIQNLKKYTDDLLHEKKQVETHKADIDIKYNSAAKENEHLKKRLEEQQQEFLRLQKNSEQTFENLANKIFNEKSNAFTQKSEKTLNDVLMPVRESLGLFQNLVHEKFNTQDKQQYALREELKRIIDINEKMTFQADSLTKALKGDNKIMGNWGEMLLERILEDSGLSKNIDYVLQSTNYTLRDEEGTKQIPDVIIKLPENKEIIIDAKVSLLSYERIISHPDEKAIHEKAFLKSVRSHIDGLSSKKYHHNEKLLSPDFVLMFMPIEGAYNLAMQLDNQLHHYAWNKRIAIVSNTTLFATLRTVASLWRIEKQNKNAEEIAKRAGSLYDKFFGFIKDLEDINKKFTQTQDSFNSALNKLSNGKGNILSQVETLKELGAKTTKSISLNPIKEVESA